VNVSVDRWRSLRCLGRKSGDDPEEKDQLYNHQNRGDYPHEILYLRGYLRHKYAQNVANCPSNAKDDHDGKQEVHGRDT
jgi:hypothetical protein